MARKPVQSTWASRIDASPTIPIAPTCVGTPPNRAMARPITPMINVREGTVQFKQDGAKCTISVCDSGHVYSASICAKHSFIGNLHCLETNDNTITIDYDHMVDILDPFDAPMYNESVIAHNALGANRYVNLPNTIKQIYEACIVDNYAVDQQETEQSSSDDQPEDDYE